MKTETSVASTIRGPVLPSIREVWGLPPTNNPEAVLQTSQTHMCTTKTIGAMAHIQGIKL